MRILGALTATLLAGCQAQAPPPAQTLTDAQRTEITAAVRKVVDSVFAGAKRLDAEAVLGLVSKGDGLCLFDMDITPCSEVAKGFREAWRPDRPGRAQRQEMDGVDIRIMPLTPTIALVATTTKENRVVLADDKIERGRFASFSVYVLEDGQWRTHSTQQASWPIEAPPAK